MALEIDIGRGGEGGDDLRVTLAGTLDNRSYLEADERIRDALAEGARNLTFDLAGLDYISSMGLRVILSARKRLEGAGGQVRVENLQPAVERVFAISQVMPPDSVFFRPVGDEEPGSPEGGAGVGDETKGGGS